MKQHVAPDFLAFSSCLQRHGPRLTGQVARRAEQAAAGSPGLRDSAWQAAWRGARRLPEGLEGVTVAASPGGCHPAINPVSTADSSQQPPGGLCLFPRQETGQGGVFSPWPPRRPERVGPAPQAEVLHEAWTCDADCPSMMAAVAFETKFLREVLHWVLCVLFPLLSVELSATRCSAGSRPVRSVTSGALAPTGGSFQGSAEVKLWLPSCCGRSSDPACSARSLPHAAFPVSSR